MAEWQTLRPDLGVLGVNPPPRYRIPFLLPPAMTTNNQTSGTIFYRDDATDATAVVARDDGDPLSVEILANAFTTFLCGRVEATGAIDADRRGLFQTMNDLEVYLAESAIRGLWTNLELGGVTTLFALTENTPVDASTVTVADALITAIRKARHRNTVGLGMTLALGEQTFQDMIQDASIQQYFQTSNVGLRVGGVLDKATLAELLGLARIEVGDETIWDASGRRGTAVVIAQPSTDDKSWMRQAELGRSFTYYPSGTGNSLGFEVYKSGNPSNTLELVRAVAFRNIKILNPQRATVITNIPEGGQLPS